jgi:hypothetical protein
VDIGAIRATLVNRMRILAEYPRLGFKEAMLQAMAAVVSKKPMTGIVNLMGEVGREMVDHYHAPGFCDVIRGAQFDE